MDNNFNQQAPQQPVYQQAPQQMYQQPMYQTAPKKPVNVMELVAIICAGVSVIMAILGATFACSCSASKTFKDGVTSYTGFSPIKYTLSPIFILSIFAALFATGAIVCGIIALKQNNTAAKAGKMSYIAIVVSAFAFFYALIPTITICGYNCSMNKAKEDYVVDIYKDDDAIDDYYRELYKEYR